MIANLSYRNHSGPTNTSVMSIMPLLKLNLLITISTLFFLKKPLFILNLKFFQRPKLVREHLKKNQNSTKTNFQFLFFLF
jgi:hypothetical protein